MTIPDISSDAAPQTLGEKLRLQREADAAAEARRQRQLTEAQEREQAEKERHVRSFFADAWAKFESAILAGTEPGKAIIGRGGDSALQGVVNSYGWHFAANSKDWRNGGTGIWAAAHPYNAVWREFLTKCTDNGLVPTWLQEDDGCGIEGWWILTVDVAPAERAANASEEA